MIEEGLQGCGLFWREVGKFDAELITVGFLLNLRKPDYGSSDFEGLSAPVKVGETGVKVVIGTEIR